MFAHVATVRIAAAAVLAALCLPAADALAQSRLDRRDKVLGWEAVGRLDTGGGYCTGVLIASDLVLTAAHCVFDPAARAIPEGQMTFRAGYHDGTAIATRRIARLVVDSSYVPTPGGLLPSGNIPHDLALLQLDAPISTTDADPFALAAGPITDTPLTLVSYGRGRSEALTWERDCALTGRYAQGILGFDCDVTFGSSGAPVFVRQGQRHRIMSVVSGMSRDAGQPEAYGMTLPDRVAQLKSALRTSAARPGGSPGARRIQVGTATQPAIRRIGVGERTTGARFVKPGG